MSRPDGEPVSQILRSLRAASRDLVVVNHALDTYNQASIPIFKGSWSTNVDPGVVQRVLSHDMSMAELFRQPEFEEPLDMQGQFDGVGSELLDTLLLPGTQEVLEEPFFRLNTLRDFQDAHADADRRSLIPILRKRYNYKGGSRQFNGGFRWGLIDGESIRRPSFSSLSNELEGVEFSVSLATQLPHVRYECAFQAFDDGSGAELRQQLVINPRIAMLSINWQSWYESAKGRLPNEPQPPSGPALFLLTQGH